MHVPIQFHTLPGLLDSRAALSNFYPKACLPCREAVLFHFMMVFGMTQPGHEPMTYRVRGGHANPTQSTENAWEGQEYFQRWQINVGELNTCTVNYKDL